MILYCQWMVFNICMSMVFDLIGQLTCHVIGCKTGKNTFRSIYCFGQSFVGQIVSSVYCLSVLVLLISPNHFD